MSDHTAWERRLHAHREAVGRFTETASKLDDVAWHARRSADEWCPGQVVEHVALTYVQLRAELRGTGGMRRRLPWWKAAFLRMRFLPGILKAGRFPKARAPREIRPPESPRPKVVVLEALGADSFLFEEELTRARDGGSVRLTHPYFGRLGPEKVLGFITAHTEHHRQKLPGA